MTRITVNVQCSGKTALAAWLATALEAGCGVHSVYLDCAELAGDAATSFHRALSLRVGVAWTIADDNDQNLHLALGLQLACLW